MNSDKQLQFTFEVLVYPVIFVLAIWIVFWLEISYGLRFTKWGVFPQKIEGLKGILFSPFIHSSLKHLFNNSIPLLVLSVSLFYFYRSIRWKVLLWGLLLTGLLTWFIGRPAWHIGASGIIYMLAAFLFFKGIFSKQYQLTALALMVVFLYGSLLWYLFPIDPEISWEGHLSGFIVGVALSLVFRKNPIEEKKYDWEKEDYNPEEDPFLKHFDENGNFIEIVPKEPETEPEQTETKQDIKIIYRFKRKEKEGE
ncbi:rhomboid family intramembrane serine protease [Aureisphaera sp. CAU 1614]|uniref:Rhomboid family intramembrane serine protease n=1 Tax=Halomarinibacterium sedimenti TaxID=2857106 RepID=A0A9X1JWE5_9FLAO|nr:rhomboid family intramembrane serine protease [Halomarinibacterium sedimenti]MBW2938750.1 rhomboid family intramembrane serine protease [Halomarinibacterium sedimenti]